MRIEPTLVLIVDREWRSVAIPRNWRRDTLETVLDAAIRRTARAVEISSFAVQQRIDSGYDLSSIFFSDNSAEAGIANVLHARLFYLLHRAQEHGEIRLEFCDFAARIQAIHSRHAQIHDDEVGRILHDFLDRVDAVPSFPTNLPIGVGFQQSLKQHADGGVIIREQNSSFQRGPTSEQTMRFLLVSDALNFPLNTVFTLPNSYQRLRAVTVHGEMCHTFNP